MKNNCGPGRFLAVRSQIRRHKILPPTWPISFVRRGNELSSIEMDRRVEKNNEGNLTASPAHSDHGMQRIGRLQPARGPSGGSIPAAGNLRARRWHEGFYRCGGRVFQFLRLLRRQAGGRISPLSPGSSRRIAPIDPYRGRHGRRGGRRAVP